MGLKGTTPSVNVLHTHKANQVTLPDCCYTSNSLRLLQGTEAPIMTPGGIEPIVLPCLSTADHPLHKACNTIGSLTPGFSCQLILCVYNVVSVTMLEQPRKTILLGC